MLCRSGTVCKGFRVSRYFWQVLSRSGIGSFGSLSWPANVIPPLSSFPSFGETFGSVLFKREFSASEIGGWQEVRESSRDCGMAGVYTVMVGTIFSHASNGKTQLEIKKSG